MVRRFQKIDVKEPTKDETIKILEGLKTYYEEHHNIKYSPEAIISAVELSNKYIGDRKLPDKAIDVIDEAAAVVKINQKKKNKVVSKNDIEIVIAKMAKIPEKTISSNDRTKYKNLAFGTGRRNTKKI